MNNKNKILKLLIRPLFYGYFTVWAICAVIIITTDDSDKSCQDSETYLIPFEYSSSFFNSIEETNQRFNCSYKYLYTSAAGLFKLTGDHHNINSGKSFISLNNFMFNDYSRPPPIDCPLFT